MSRVGLHVKKQVYRTGDKWHTLGEGFNILEHDDDVISAFEPSIEYKIVVLHMARISDGHTGGQMIYMDDYIYVPEDWNATQIDAAVLRHRIDGTKVFSD